MQHRLRLQTVASIQAGQRYDVSTPVGGATSFIQSLRLNNGTRDRINQFSAQIYRDVANYYKNLKEPREPNGLPFNVYTLTFGPSETTKPLGTFNMSRTFDSILYLELAPIAKDSRLDSRKSFIYVFAEAWNIFEIKNGKGKMLFAD